jgi:hypothetical protein
MKVTVLLEALWGNKSNLNPKLFLDLALGLDQI